MKILKFLLFSVVALSLGACRSVEFTNGEVPEEYLYLAKKLEGTYQGQFNGTDGQLVVTFVGNKPRVEFKGQLGEDILGTSCGSTIGNLKKVSLTGPKEDLQVSDAIFGFSPGRCGSAVRGREINFEFKRNYNRIHASILKDQRNERRCTWDGGVPPHVPPREVCRYEPVADFLLGRFQR